jgi:hypothetical protein
VTEETMIHASDRKALGAGVKGRVEGYRKCIFLAFVNIRATEPVMFFLESRNVDRILGSQGPNFWQSTCQVLNTKKREMAKAEPGNLLHGLGTRHGRRQVLHPGGFLLSEAGLVPCPGE